MAPKRILIVDDDSYVREATEAILSTKGYEVDTAPEAKTDPAVLSPSLGRRFSVGVHY